MVNDKEKPDPEINAVQAVRRKISETCGNDPKQLVKFYQEYTVELKKTGDYRFIGSKDKGMKELFLDTKF